MIPLLLTRPRPAPGGAEPELEYLGDIVPFLDGTHDSNPTYASGNVITVPDGLYSVGDAGDAFGTVQINTGRATKKYVKAQTNNGVKVDLAHFGGTELAFGNGASVLDMNLVIAGMDIYNGTVEIDSCSDLTFFYGRLAQPRSQWWAQAVAAAARLGSPYNNRTARDRDPFGDNAYLLGPGTGSPQSGLTRTQWNAVANEMASWFGPLRVTAGHGASQRIGFYGVDIEGSPDDGVYAAGVWDLHVEGCRIFDITEFEPQANGNGISVDPGHDVFSTGQEDAFHSDCVQLGASGWRPVIRDSWLGGRIMWNTLPHSTKRISAGGTGWDVLFTNLWLGGQPQVSGSGRGYTSGLIARTIEEDVPGWTGRADDSFDSLPGIVVSSSTANAPDWSGTISNVVHVATSGSILSYPAASSGSYTNLTRTSNTQSRPAGITDLFDEAQIRDHASNPANIWRATAGKAYSDMTTVV